MANITSFSPKNNSSITVDNSTFWVENANQSWSLTEPDANTLRFELQSGDHWSSPAWTDPASSQRDEIAGQTVYAPGTQVNLAYDFMIEPGATDTANGPGRWTVLGQMHEYNVSDSPPFAVELVNGDHMAINIGTGNPVYLYTDPNPIQRGHYYSMNIQAKFDNNGNGFLEVWRDGVQIVNYHGSIGTGAATYWKEGLYRSSASETMAVDYRNLNITTGSAPVPSATTPTHSATTPTQPATTPTKPVTTPTKPVTTPTPPATTPQATTPSATTPSVTQVVASPTSGIENVGKTITLTLDLNKAVTVTGTPTLTLNDGGTATYKGGSGTSALTFSYTVGATDTNTSALAITAVNLPGGASVKDAAGTAAHLSGAVKTLSGVQIDTTTPAVTTPAVTTPAAANITSFSPTNNSSITVDNNAYWVENANQNWSLTEPNADTLRFELRSGDHWSSPAWTDPTSEQRDEIAGTKVYAAGTQVNLAYDFMIEPGATDTANGPGRFTVLGQMHENNVSDSPPFAVELVNGDHMAINIGTGNPVYLYTDPNPIQRGHYYSMNIQAKFDNNGNGFLEVWRDGVQIVNYHGSIGTGAATYWKEGLYRSSASETMAVDYRNLNITTGSAPVPSATTPTHSATTPSVTQVVASPSTGTELPGNTISLTLKFNEAVTVTGKPTLSLNDGGTATYTGGSGTNTLTFTDTVRSSDRTVSALGVTAVNLPQQAAIKDAAGTAANLAGALRTLSGLAIDPPTSAASHPPTISIKDPSLSMPAHGKIDLGLNVTAPNSANASVTISGLPRYEAITDNLDHKTFHGSSITLSKAEVDSGLTLQSNNSWHSGHPAITLTVTAHDSTAGGSASSAARTITVKNLPATSSTMSSFALLNQHLAGDFNGNTGQGEITSRSSSVHNDWVLANSRH